MAPTIIPKKTTNPTIIKINTSPEELDQFVLLQFGHFDANSFVA